MRITPELIDGCYQYTNKATTDRELRMRGLKIPAIENLGSTLNRFDCFDLSDNIIRKLENLPLLPRLKCLLLNNNRIYRIAPHLEESVPNLERLILTNNYIQELGDIDALSTLSNLRVLSLVNNPVTEKEHYRLYVIHKLPHLRLLDFSKVKKSERDDAQREFTGVEGEEKAKRIGIKSKAVDDDLKRELEERDREHLKKVHLEDARAAEKDAINMQSIQRINNLLKSGYIPGAKRRKGDHIDDVDIESNNQ